MGNQYRKTLTIFLIAIFTLAGNADAHHVCLGTNQLTCNSDPAGHVIYLSNTYNWDKLDLNIITDNIIGFTRTNSLICNVPDCVKSRFSSFLNEAPFTAVLFDRNTSIVTSNAYAAFNKNSNESNILTQILSYRQSDNKGFIYIGSLATNSKFADTGLHRMQLTNLCKKPIPEPTDASLVYLVLADWYSITSVNKQMMWF
jgi:hypothetical protein